MFRFTGRSYFHRAALDCLLELVVIALVLVGVGLGEVGDGAVEGVAAAEVGGDSDAVAGACMGAGERPAAGRP